jgi:hypothetical protein
MVVYGICCVNCGTRRTAREVDDEIEPFVAGCRECGETAYEILHDEYGD